VRTALALVALGVLLAGCTGTGLKHDMAVTADNVGKIRAGNLDVSLLVTPRAKAAKNPFGWKLRGPFSFGDVPTAHVTYTQIANGHTGETTIVLGKDGGYAVVDGEQRPLTAAHLGELRDAAARARRGASIDVSGWVKSATSCGTRCARGELDVAQAANTLFQISGSKASLSDDEAKQLAEAAHAATYRIEWTRDHLLRKLTVHVDLGFDVAPRLRSALGDLVGATFDFRLGVANPRT
jgi:hypothetical protein